MCCHFSGDNARRSAAVRRPRQAGSSQHLLNHQRVHIHKAHLKQVQRQHQYLLVFPPVGGELSTLSVENEVVGTVPVFDDL